MSKGWADSQASIPTPAVTGPPRVKPPSLPLTVSPWFSCLFPYLCFLLCKCGNSIHLMGRGGLAQHLLTVALDKYLVGRRTLGGQLCSGTDPGTPEFPAPPPTLLVVYRLEWLRVPDCLWPSIILSLFHFYGTPHSQKCPHWGNKVLGT